MSGLLSRAEGGDRSTLRTSGIMEGSAPVRAAFPACSYRIATGTNDYRARKPESRWRSSSNLC